MRLGTDESGREAISQVLAELCHSTFVDGRLELVPSDISTGLLLLHEEELAARDAQRTEDSAQTASHEKPSHTATSHRERGSEALG